MIADPTRFRLKALACENAAREAPDVATKLAWQELAIEWHALARRIKELSEGRVAE
jgi:hypothetical protein